MDEILYEGVEDSEKDNLENHQRLCRLSDSIYAICPKYCCGEFWESSPQFCCASDFKPIRNLFFFLLAAFVTLFLTVLIYLLVEYIVRMNIMKKITKLEQLFPHIASIESNYRISSSSVDTSIDEDSTTSVQPTHSRYPKQVLNKHSQSFKDMSKLNSMKRMAKIKSSIERFQLG